MKVPLKTAKLIGLLIQVSVINAVAFASDVDTSSVEHNEEDQGISSVEFANQSLVERSRAIVDKYSEQLQEILLSELKERGPTSAIAVCKNQAPKIAENLSVESGAEVERTSRRVRNPNNFPDVWQQNVLENFDANKIDKSKQEYFQQFENGAAKYMQAISIKPVCLLCHGSGIGKYTREALSAEYADDQAVGYEIGDIRGAFNVTWPASAINTGRVDTNGDGSSQELPKQMLINQGIATRDVLSSVEVAALEDALDDEYKALATYEKVLEDFGEVRPFSNISRAEARHIDALHRVYTTYSLNPSPNPYDGNIPAFNSVQEACTAAIQAEIDNAALYERVMQSTHRENILMVFRNLRDASLEKHLPAFKRCSQRKGK